MPTLCHVSWWKTTERTVKIMERTVKTMERTVKIMERTVKTMERTVKIMERTVKIIERMASQCVKPGVTILDAVPVSWMIFWLHLIFRGMTLKVVLTHLPLVSHICVNESSQHRSDNGLSPIRHQAIYLNQCLDIVNWTLENKLQWNFNENSKFSFRKMHLKISSAKWRRFSRGGGLMRNKDRV